MEKSTGTGSQLWSVQYNSGRFKINLDNLGPSDNSGITAEWSRIFPNKIVPYCTPNDPEWSKGLFRTIQEQLLAVCEVLKVHELYCKLKGTIWYLKTVLIILENILIVISMSVWQTWSLKAYNLKKSKHFSFFIDDLALNFQIVLIQWSLTIYGTTSKIVTIVPLSN